LIVYIIISEIENIFCAKMKLIVQRVKKASVEINNNIYSKMDHFGLLIYVAFCKGDCTKNADYLAEKAIGLRIFEDNNNKMNLSVRDVKGYVMVVPEFTLYADCSRGKRPSFDMSAGFEDAKKLFEYFVEKLKTLHSNVITGAFRQHMQVASINDGPVTFILEKNNNIQ